MNLIDSVQLRQARPPCPNCLCDSDIGDLAVAAGRSVIILKPDRVKAREKGTRSFIEVRIKVNEFAEDEWPSQAPAPFSEMSIGAEQSNSHIIALSWSPSGLGFNHRPILAVLTANHLLSFWASQLDPFRPDSWSRICVLNDQIQKLLGQSEKGALRIRSFAWATQSESTQNSECHKWGPFILAISTDSGAYVLETSSRWDDGRISPNIHVLGNINSRPLQPSTFRPSLLSTYLDQRRFLRLDKFALLGANGTTRQFRLIIQDGQQFCQIELEINGEYFAAEYLIRERIVGLQQGLSTDIPVPDPRTDLAIEEFRTQIAGAQNTVASNIDVQLHGSCHLTDLTILCVTWQIIQAISYKTAADETSTLLFSIADASAGQNQLSLWKTRTVNGVDALLSIIAKTLKASESIAILDMRGAKCLFATIMTAFVLPAEILRSILQPIQGLLSQFERIIEDDNYTKEERVWLSDAKNLDEAEFATRLEEKEGNLQARVAAIFEAKQVAGVLDLCPVPGCDSPVGWDLEGRAQCLRRHPLGIRCSITFLPMLRPNARTKTCEGCGRKSLRLPSNKMDASNGDGTALSSTIEVQVLAHFEVCPYCSGHFYCDR